MKTLFTLICAGLLGFEVSAKETNSAALPPKTVSDFEFKGPGNLDQFVDAIEASFGINLRQVATIPDTLRHTVTVPKMRLNVESEQGQLRLGDVLYLYNNLSEKGDSSMGRWIMESTRGTSEPQTILLVPTRSRPESSFAVRAFSLPASNSEETQRIVSILEKIMIAQTERLSVVGFYFGISEGDVRGRLDFHSEAGILIATGGKAYVEMAASIIEAYKEKLSRADVPIPGKPKPDQP